MSKRESKKIFVEEFPEFLPATKEDELLFQMGLGFAKRFSNYTSPVKDDHRINLRGISIDLPKPFRSVRVEKSYHLFGNETIYSTLISVGTLVEPNKTVTAHDLKEKGQSYVRNYLAAEIGFYF